MKLNEFYNKYETLLKRFKDYDHNDYLLDSGTDKRLEEVFSFFQTNIEKTTINEYYIDVMHLDITTVSTEYFIETTHNYFEEKFLENKKIIERYDEMKIFIQDFENISDLTADNRAEIVNFVGFIIIDTSNYYSEYYLDHIFNMYKFLYYIFQYFNERGLISFSFEYLYYIDIISSVLQSQLFDISILHKNSVGNKISYKLELLKNKQIEDMKNLF